MWKSNQLKLKVCDLLSKKREEYFNAAAYIESTDKSDKSAKRILRHSG